MSTHAGPQSTHTPCMQRSSAAAACRHPHLRAVSRFESPLQHGELTRRQCWRGGPWLRLRLVHDVITRSCIGKRCTCSAASARGCVPRQQQHAPAAGRKLLKDFQRRCIQASTVDCWTNYRLSEPNRALAVKFHAAAPPSTTSYSGPSNGRSRRHQPPDLAASRLVSRAGTALRSMYRYLHFLFWATAL
jgi:hypothetical protein